MARSLYGLSEPEFETLARLSVRRHDTEGGARGMRLLPSGGGFYDGGPALRVVVGLDSVAHDLTPVVPADGDYSRADDSVRMLVPEGVLVVLDGHVRSRYAHGYAEDKHFFTLEWSLDCMRRTRTIGTVQALGWLVMHTPVLSRHCVQVAEAKQQGEQWPMDCPVHQLIARMRARLQDRESYLLSQPVVGENSPSRSMAE